eukprot:1921711-Alexandrium_andersonii.AAC.1
MRGYTWASSLSGHRDRPTIAVCANDCDPLQQQQQQQRQGNGSAHAATTVGFPETRAGLGFC